jgi:hypothetical protein
MSGPDHTVYPIWREAFGEVLDTRLYSLVWLDGRVAQGCALLWSADDAAMLAEVRFYPTGAKDIYGLVAAGDLDTITGKLIPEAEEWARAAGCIGAVIESREGWVRSLKASGYHLYQTAVRKEL